MRTLPWALLYIFINVSPGSGCEINDILFDNIRLERIRKKGSVVESSESIPIVNAGFEEDCAPHMDTYCNVVPRGWSEYNPHHINRESIYENLGVVNPSRIKEYMGGQGATEGIQSLFTAIHPGDFHLGEVGVEQRLRSSVSAESTYVLRVDIGNPLRWNTKDLHGWPQARVDLLAGDEVIAQQTVFTLPDTKWTTVTVQYTTSATTAPHKLLGIRLVDLNHLPTQPPAPPTNPRNSARILLPVPLNPRGVCGAPTIGTTAQPTIEHTAQQNIEPTAQPSIGPTAQPTKAPAEAVTASRAPTRVPVTVTLNPSIIPVTSSPVATKNPTSFPIRLPSVGPTVIDITSTPSRYPSNHPIASIHPSLTPTDYPIATGHSATHKPTKNPTSSPSNVPSGYLLWIMTPTAADNPTTFRFSSTFETASMDTESSQDETESEANAKDAFAMVSKNIWAIMIAVFLSTVCCIIVVMMHQKQKKQKNVLRLARAHLEKAAADAERDSSSNHSNVELPAAANVANGTNGIRVGEANKAAYAGAVDALPEVPVTNDSDIIAMAYTDEGNAVCAGDAAVHVMDTANGNARDEVEVNGIMIHSMHSVHLAAKDETVIGDDETETGGENALPETCVHQTHGRDD